jgi:hypothetical protein
MRKGYGIVILVLLSVSITFASAQEAAPSGKERSPTIAIYYFYQEFCPSCETKDIDAFYKFLDKALPFAERQKYSLDIETYNTGKTTGMAVYKDCAAKAGIAGQEREDLNALYIGVGNKGTVIQGFDRIKKNFRRVFEKTIKGKI